MDRAVQKRIIEDVKKYRINRVKIGGGEPTLNPDFFDFCKELSQNTRFLSVVTNAQWRDATMIKYLIESKLSMIEVSVDAGGKSVYESSRVGADYDLLQNNLRELIAYRNKMKSKTLIKIRLMLRPSTMHLERTESELWKNCSDAVLPQYIMKSPESDYESDVFISYNSQNNIIPRCTVPFKDLQVRVNGDVPYCQILGSKLNKQDRMIAGNLLKTDISAIWNKEIKKFRDEHRNRQHNLTEICRSCKGS
jgi:radical SAM protein with 4Fe4S-binding SPASM domain